jgi:hypothetical protein
MTQQATSPFVNTSASAMLGLGAPIVQTYDVTAQTASGPITLTFSQPITKGRLRVKSSGLNAATTVAIGAVTVSDGTNVVVVKPALLAATTAGQNFDVSVEIITDIQATSLTFGTTLGGATTTATINSEFFGNP